MIRCLKRIALALGLLLGSITFIVWFLWIPSAQEPTYIFYEAWGEAGSNPGQFRDPTGIAVTADEVLSAMPAIVASRYSITTVALNTRLQVAACQRLNWGDP
ncbi:MAG: hypothetical protein MK319_00365 [Pseudomonadales bacterium]|nr:hypothetical protein [Pseudomonadales bacterium]